MKNKIASMSLLLFFTVAIIGCANPTYNAPTPTAKTDINIGE